MKMAACDYYLCDVCGSKCFYDSDLAWERSANPSECLVSNPGMKLGCCGDIAAICRKCTETHEIVVRPKP